MTRRRDLNAALAALALVGASGPTPALAATQRGELVPWPDVELLDGGRFGAAQAAAQVVVVVFWSTSCPFCRRHNQHVQRLHEAAKDLPLRVLGVALDRDAEVVRRYARQQAYGFPITLDHAPLAAVLAPRRMVPFTVVVDRQGRLQEQIPGEMFQDDVLQLQRLAAPVPRS